jgi:trehalose 6-phosphate phosphatase
VRIDPSLDLAGRFGEKPVPAAIRTRRARRQRNDRTTRELTMERAAPRHRAHGRPLAASADWALFLDIDGTLAKIAPRPDKARVAEPLKETLAELAPCLGGAVALVSGRSVAAVDALVAPLRLPTAGKHGQEWRDIEGRLHRVEHGLDLEPVRRALHEFADGQPRLVLEDKGDAFALHYRLAPEREAAARALVTSLVGGYQGALSLLDGSKVFDIKPTVVDKGRAVATFMTQAPFAGRRPVFVGDDLTDEDGFAAAERLGGYGVLVGPRCGSRADYHLPDVAAVTRWLERLVRVLCGQPTAARADR